MPFPNKIFSTRTFLHKNRSKTTIKILFLDGSLPAINLVAKMWAIVIEMFEFNEENSKDELSSSSFIDFESKKNLISFLKETLKNLEQDEDT